MRDYLLAFACIFGINLLPAFGPPTWAVLVFFRINGDLDIAPLVLGGPLTCAFFAGRLVSYSIYAGGAALVQTSLEGAFTGVFTSPLGIALQVLMLAALVALIRVDWVKSLSRTENRGSSRERKSDDMTPATP